MVMLGSLIFVHELGHFLVGKFFGIAVEIFSVGFGPKILSWQSKGTDYQVCLLPLGGFVKFSGAFPGEQVKSGLSGKPFNESSCFARFMTILAGPLANIIFAVAIYSVIGFVGVEKLPAYIGKVMPDSPAAQAGLQPSDEVLSIDGKAIDGWNEMNEIVIKSSGKTLALKVRRSEGLLDETSIKDIAITPREVEGEDILGRKITRGQLGVSVGIVPATLTVKLESPASIAGFRTGDKVVAASLAADNIEVKSFDHLRKIFLQNLATGNLPLQVSVERIGEEGEKPLALPAVASFDQLGIASSVLTVRKIMDDVSNIDVPLKFADKIVEIKGQPVVDLYGLQTVLEANTQEKVKVVVSRRGQRMPFDIKLKAVEMQKPEGKVTAFVLPVELLGAYGIPDLKTDRYPYGYDSLWYGVKTTAMQTGMIVYTFSQLLMGKLPIKSLGGPILIAKVAGDTAKLGWKAFVTAMALISINLAVVNLFPIPALDGGQLVLVGLEAIRRKPISIKAFENYQKVGFILILALVVLAFSNDLSRFWGDIVSGITGGSK